MRFAFESAINALEAFLILDFLARYFGFRVEGTKRWGGCALFWVISIVAVTCFSAMAAFQITSSLVQIVINFIFCRALLKGDMWIQAILSAFTMIGIMAIAGFTAFLFGHIFNAGLVSIFTRFDSVRVIAVLLTKLLFFQITRIILRFKRHSRIEKQDVFPLVVFPVLSILTIGLITSAALQAPETQNKIFLAVCLLIVLNLLTYWLFVSLARSSQLKSDYEMLALKHASDQQNAADIQNLYDKVRSIRHDMNNHLLCLSRMVETGSSQTETMQYLQNLLRQQDEVSQTFVFSGNDALDAILNVKQSAAFHAGIAFCPVITQSLRFMAAEDICILFGNLLDNAIEAAKQAQRKEISLTIQPADDYAMIILSNSIARSVLDENPTLNTTKTIKEGHGYGVKNINKIIQKYHGHLRHYEEDNHFITEILLAITPTAL